MKIHEDNSTITLTVIPRGFEETSNYPSVVAHFVEDGAGTEISLNLDSQVKNSNDFTFTFTDASNGLKEDRIYSFTIKSSGSTIYRGKFVIGYTNGGSFDHTSKQSIHTDIDGNNDYKAPSDEKQKYIILD